MNLNKILTGAINRLYDEELINYLNEFIRFPKLKDVYLFNSLPYTVTKIRYNCIYQFESPTHKFVISQVELLKWRPTRGTTSKQSN
jgi:hypothetical protein